MNTPLFISVHIANIVSLMNNIQPITHTHNIHHTFTTQSHQQRQEKYDKAKYEVENE